MKKEAPQTPKIRTCKENVEFIRECHPRLYVICRNANAIDELLYLIDDIREELNQALDLSNLTIEKMNDSTT
jgi:hypothetical protein